MTLMSGAFMGILRPGMGHLPAHGAYGWHSCMCAIYIFLICFFPCLAYAFPYVHLSMVTLPAALSLVCPSVCTSSEWICHHPAPRTSR